jgi:4-hydroxy-tetrahydrodipicolinate synthase
VTPFNDDNTINYDDIEKWVKMQAVSNVTGLVLLGTTSESPTLSREEQLEIVKFVYRTNCHSTTQKFLVVGVGGNNTMETLEFAKLCKVYCDGFMVTVPSYNKPTQNGIKQHFETICNDESLQIHPVIMYNVPSRTGVNMEPKIIKQVFDSCKTIVAIKEASGSIDQLIEIRSLVPDLKVFSGDDKLILDVMVHGGCGVISVASNIFPDLVAKLVNLSLDEKFKQATEIYYGSEFVNLLKYMFCETNPIPIKYMMVQGNIYKNYKMRLPMTELSNEKHEFVDEALLKTGVYHQINLLKLDSKMSVH